MNDELDNSEIDNVISYRSIGNTLNICQVNVEGLSKDKCEFLSKLLIDNNTEVLLMQETHKADESRLIDSINHSKYGVATYTKTTLKDISVLAKMNENNIAVLAIKVGQTTIVNIYKPPSIEWTFPLPTFEHPVVYMGDFNSHPNCGIMKETTIMVSKS